LCGKPNGDTKEGVLMKYLITGGLGFIGSKIIEQLSNDGHSITCVDNKDTYGIISSVGLNKLMSWRTRNWDNKNISTINGDLLDRDVCLRAFKNRPDVVIHLATYPRAKIVDEDPIQGIPKVIGTTTNLLWHASKFGTKKFVYISSSMVYGDFVDGTKEDSNTKPQNIYGEAKLTGERLTKLFAKRDGLNYIIVRPSGVYGPGDLPDRVVSKFFAKAMNNETITLHNGENKVDFTYRDDAASGIDPNTGQLEEDLLNDMRDAIENKILAAGGTHGGISSSLFTSVMQIMESSKSVKLHALRAFSCDYKVNMIKNMFPVKRKSTSVVPIRPTMRQMFMLSQGIIPVRWNCERTKMDEEKKNIAVYLDVSGSVHSYLPKILGVITTLKQNIETIFCFSNIVSEHSMKDLEQGRFKTTGGTDFDCIVEHALERNIKKLVVFTDGYAWLNDKNKKLAEENIKDAAIIYFGSHTKSNFFQSYGKDFKLEELLK
jgi:nucleoside-diphosphate-sugar epimerase